MSILIYAVEEPFWQDVLIDLEKKGTKIGHAIVQYRYSYVPNQFFEDFKGTQLDGKMFYRKDDVAKLIEEHFGDKYPALDKETLKFFEEAERDFYILTDRFCYHPISFRERKRLFRESLRFWLAFFKENNITQLFGTCSPHNLSDFTAYQVARYLKLPITQFWHTVINDHIIIRSDYAEEESVPEDYMKGATKEEVKNKIPELLYDCTFSENKVLSYVVGKSDAIHKTKNVEKKKEKGDIGKKLAKFASRIGRVLFRSPKFKGALAMNGVYPASYRRFIRQFDARWQRKQQKMHDERATMPDLNEKYIYFAMHRQPERTSTPECAMFEDQLVAIENLSKAVPDGWKVFVKENPMQFSRAVSLKGKHYRDGTDYDDLLRMDNVELISQKIPSKDLIANTQIISTLSGTVAWEAARAGKCSIIFSNAWYVASRSILRVNNIAECKLAIETAISKSKEDVELDMLKYLSYMHEEGKLFLGNMGDSDYIRNLTLPYEDHVKSLSEKLHKNLKT